MASPHLDIARVSFSAVLLRHDPTPCARSDIDEFLRLVDATVSRCSRANVQNTKQWILENLVPSPARVAALSKYLAALAASITTDLATTRRERQPSSKRRRLHIVYILNDVLHHTYVRTRDSSFAAGLEPVLPGLIRCVASFPDCPKHAKKIQLVLDLWADNQYYGPSLIEKLRGIAREAPKTQPEADLANGPATDPSAPTTKPARETPFIMPSTHGDPSVPWYDLPAANWLPVIEPNSTRPMNPAMVKPLQFAAGPADKQIVKAVQDLLADVDRLYGEGSDILDNAADMGDTNQLGERVVVDEVTGEIIGGDTYYGWSRGFCDKMKQRKKKQQKQQGGADEDRGRSGSRSSYYSSRDGSSRSSSRAPAFKRRRMSSESRSPSPRGRRGRSDSQGDRRQRQSSRSRSRSWPRSPPSGPRLQGNSGISNTNQNNSNNNNSPAWGGQQQYQQQPQHHHHHPPPFPPIPFQVPPPTGGGVGGWHVPPPPPPPPPHNYQGQWPPPPPPPHMQGIGGGGPPQNHHWPPPPPPPPMGGGGGGWAAAGVGNEAPPPPPPQFPQQHQQQYSQGGGGGSEYGYGRGGGGGGRGRGGYGGNFRGGRGGWSHHRGGGRGGGGVW